MKAARADKVERLARRLAAQHIARYLGLNVEYVYRRYVSRQPIGAPWLDIARRALAEPKKTIDSRRHSRLM